MSYTHKYCKNSLPVFSLHCGETRRVQNILLERWYRHYLIFPKCRIYDTVNWVSIGLGNGLSPAQRQAIA